MTGSDIPDRHADSALTNPKLGNGSVYGQILNRSWETLPVQPNLRNPSGSHTAALHVLVCTRTLQQLKWCFRTAETHKRYDHNSSHVRSQSFATEQWQSAVNQAQSSQRWVELNQRSVPNQWSNIRSFSGPSLPPHAKFDRPRHPKNMWWQLTRREFYFRSARIVIVTHRSANEKESAGRLGSPGLPDLLFWRQISQVWLFLETVNVKKMFVFFSILHLPSFGGSWQMLSDWCLFKYLVEKCHWDF